MADTVKPILDLWEYLDERLALYKGIVGYIIDDFFLSFETSEGIFDAKIFRFF